MAENDTAGAEAPVADDLHSTLSAAWDEQEKADSAASPSSDTPVNDTAAAVTNAVTEKPAGERARDEQGRFAAKPAEDPMAKAAQAFETKPADQQQVQQPQTPVVGPPPGWSPTAKAAFDALPGEVKEAIARREDEINRGFQKLSDYKGLDPYVDMARNAGQSLNQVLDNYIAAERLLDQNFAGGIVHLCNQYGIDPAQLAAVLTGNQAPSQQQAQDPMFQRVQFLEQRLHNYEQTREEAEQTAINSELTSFERDPANRYFPNVRGAMAQLMQIGQATSLKDAYEKACWADPEIRGLFIKEQNDRFMAEQAKAADQKRRASSSLPAGAPLNGAMQHAPKNSIRDELESNWDQSVA